jgi:protein SCO1/2
MTTHRTTVAVAVLAVVLVVSSLGVLYFSGFWDRGATRYGPGAGQALVTPLSAPTRGGPFSLVDHRGRAVTDEDFRDSFMLVFFGYTYCPDICPTELNTMALALDLLDEAGEKVQPILISVDPERDTTEMLADYVTAFHPRLIGLTGTLAQVAAAAKVYHARYLKVPWPSAEADGESDASESTDYGVAHSASVYLVAPGGRILATYPRGMTPEHMAADIRGFLESRT